jgi:hypothetical protein
MTKIKNFRITLRSREIARWLKKERGLELTPDLELTVDQLIKEGKDYIEPAAVYSTLTRPVAEKTTTITFPEKAIATSLIVVSIGSVLNGKRVEALSDSGRESLLSALEQEALSQSISFASRLLQDQAKEEDCELSTPEAVLDPVMASSLASLVGVQRIGINLDATGAELPSYARAAWLFWTPIGKKGGRAPAYRQSGAEKAVV